VGRWKKVQAAALGCFGPVLSEHLWHFQKAAMMTSGTYNDSALFRPAFFEMIF
jgi:hypothetical protein